MEIQKPRLVIVGGPNGSGKTTFAYQYRDDYAIQYLGADEIAANIGGKIEDNQVEAGRIFFRRFDEIVSNRESVIVESTLSGNGIVKKIQNYKALGYEVHLVFVYLSKPTRCVNRVGLRVKKGGHFVPTEDVIRRYYRSIKNFKNKYVGMVDTWQLFNNDGDVPIEVAVGDLHEQLIYNEIYFNNFMEIENEK